MGFMSSEENTLNEGGGLEKAIVTVIPGMKRLKGINHRRVEMKKGLLTIVFLQLIFASLLLAGTKGKIAGRVVDVETGAPPRRCECAD